MKPNVMREGYIYNSNDELAAKIYTRILYIGTGNANLIKSSCFEIWRLNSDKCTFYINSDRYELKNKDIVFVNRNDNYGYELYKSRISFSVIKIYPNVLANLLPKCQLLKNGISLSELNPKVGNHLNCNDSLAEKISVSLNKINDLFTNKENYCEILATAEILTMFSNIAKHTHNTVAAPKRAAKPDAALVKSIEYINSHLSEELTLEKISEVCGLSPNYFSNLFRSQTGVKLWDYIGEQRINLATKYLLENPSEPIISIALRCGFNNCPNFNRTFKKITGQTPKKYKTLIVRQESFNE